MPHVMLDVSESQINIAVCADITRLVWGWSGCQVASCLHGENGWTDRQMHKPVSKGGGS